MFEDLRMVELLTSLTADVLYLEPPDSGDQCMVWGLLAMLRTRLRRVSRHRREPFDPYERLHVSSGVGFSTATNLSYYTRLDLTIPPNDKSLIEGSLVQGVFKQDEAA